MTKDLKKIFLHYRVLVSNIRFRFSFFFIALFENIEKIILTFVSPSGVTWLLMLYAMKSGWIEMASEAFLVFTGTVILGKKYINLKKKLEGI